MVNVMCSSIDKLICITVWRKLCGRLQLFSAVEIILIH